MNKHCNSIDPAQWSLQVTIGVTQKDIGRSTADDSSRLGHNEHSWSLYWSGTAFSLWHAGKETVLAAPKARRIGVYVDQQAGVLAFYRVSHNQVHHICCVETEFSGALYPGFRFWSGVGSTITICQLGWVMKAHENPYLWCYLTDVSYFDFQLSVNVYGDLWLWSVKFVDSPLGATTSIQINESLSVQGFQKQST